MRFTPIALINNNAGDLTNNKQQMAHWHPLEDPGRKSASEFSRRTDLEEAL